MKQPLWKRLLSYIKSVYVETTESEHNPYLRVVLRNGRYQLLTANAIYSYGDLYDNFSRAFEQIDLDRLQIKEVLILGFGLGSIPVMLENMFQKKYYYTAVEIDPEILRLANTYVVPDIQSGIEFQLSDARVFAEFCTEKYDMICMDVFLDDQVPTELEHEDFLINLKKMLSPNGILLFNKLAYVKKDKKEAEAFFQNHFKRIFTEGVYLDVKGNYILLNRGDILKK
ncbi:MAG: fused MFS/spermidine synthase [Saprospiraceae bacterium]|nr:fused MFS/spermidine synthase [Saprospiraceae bacterium]